MTSADATQGDDKQVPLHERAEMPPPPEIPKGAGRDIAILERDFVEAEVEVCKFFFCIYFLLSTILPVEVDLS
jgi:hypothetical protein